MKGAITVPYNFIPRDYQLDLFQAMDGIEGMPETKIRRAILLWHRRAGKDMACLAYLLKEAVATPGLYYYLFPDGAMGRRAMWEHIDSRTGVKALEMLPGVFDTHSYGKPGSLIEGVNNQEMVIRLTNKSIIRIIGTDRFDKLRGTNPVGCVFSEYAFQDPKAWEIVSPILAENNGWAIFNSTPDGFNHFHQMFNNAENEDKWYRSLLQTLYPEEEGYSGIVPKEVIDDELRMGKDPAVVAMEYGCRFLVAESGAYYNSYIEKARMDGRIGLYPADDSKWTETAWDIGAADPTSIFFFQRHGSTIRIVDYYEDETGTKGYADYVTMLQERGYRYKAHHLPHDGKHRKTVKTGVTTAIDMLSECLKEAGVSGRVYDVKKGDVQTGIEQVRHTFSRLYFNEGTCHEAIEKLGLYHKRYDRKARAYMKQPVHDHTSHCADALRYLVQAVERETVDPRRIRKPTIKIRNNPFDY